MSQVRLSICMPTYNFGAFIGDTLASISPQLQTGVEIVILDGGSTDDTGKVVESYARRFPQILYERQPFRGGIDRDMARSVDIAHGDYCWLFSSDVLMKPGQPDFQLRLHRRVGQRLRDVRSVVPGSPGRTGVD